MLFFFFKKNGFECGMLVRKFVLKLEEGVELNLIIMVIIAKSLQFTSLTYE